MFAHLPEECVADISRCTTPKFAVGARERCIFVVTPFRGNPKAALASRIGSDEDIGSNASHASSAVVLKRTPQCVLWADHATRKIFPRVQFWSYWKYDFFWIGSWAMTIAPDQRWYGSQRNYGSSQ